VTSHGAAADLAPEAAGIDAYVAGLPKVELHVHLEGSLRPDTRRRLAERHRVELRERSGPAEFTDFNAFIAAFAEGLGLLRDGADLVTAIDALAEDLAAQRVRYAEVTTTAWAHIAGGRMSAGEYRDALAEGRTRARRDHDVELGWVIDIPRGFESPDSGFTADLLSGPHCPDGTVAIGLGGAEIGYPARWYQASFERVRAFGLGGVPHGGETGGADYVRECIEFLRADRIGHGVMAIEDPEVVALARDRGVPFEVSLTSNVLLGVAPDVERHPLGALREAGIVVTLATDDPGYFDTDLGRELRLAHDHHAYDAAGLHQMELDSLAMSFAPDGVRQRVQAELGAYPRS
jgi:aminodeoxyfutalosine deaminase